MPLVEFWLGGGETIRHHQVDEAAIARCYALPKTADRFAYWRQVTGDQLIAGRVLVWSPVRESPAHL
jgi:hypothetical protein